MTQRILSLGDAEDVAHILMHTENDLLLQANINGAAAIYGQELAIYGDCGAMEVRNDENNRQYIYLKYFDPAQLEEKTASESMTAENRCYPSDNIQWIIEKIPLPNELWLNFYAECLPYLTGTGPSFIPLEETLRVMELLQKFHDECDK